MEWWHIYLFTRLDGLNTIFTISFGVAVFTTVAAIIYWSANAGLCEDEAEDGKKWTVRSAAVTIALALASIAIPTQKEAAAIYLIPKLANSQFTKEASQIPTDAAKLLRLKLEQYIAEIEPTAVAVSKEEKK